MGLEKYPNCGAALRAEVVESPLWQSLLTLIGLLASALLAHPAARDAGRSEAHARSARIVHEYTMPPYGLEHFGVGPDELSVARVWNGFSQSNLPSIGSGLHHLFGGWYVGMTDRGPSPDRAAASAPNPVTPAGKVFPLPRFRPSLILLQAEGDQIIPRGVIPLRDPHGVPITGLPNRPGSNATDDEYAYWTNEMGVQMVLAPDANALDIEDGRLLPGGRWVLVEEYRPSIVIVSPDGTVLKRYIPANVPLSCAYPVNNTVIPEVFKNRRVNRGFESVAVSSSGRKAYVVTQSPLGPAPGAGDTQESRVFRLLELDLTDPIEASLTAEYILFGSPVAQYPDPGHKGQADLKICAMDWVGPGRLLLLERAAAMAKLVLVDFSRATNVKNLPLAQTLALELLTPSSLPPRIVAARTEVVLTLSTNVQSAGLIPVDLIIPDDKLEGLSILNADEVALANDNDFGVSVAPSPCKVWVIRLKDRLPIVR